MSKSTLSSNLVTVRHLGLLRYADALKVQEEYHAAVVAGAQGVILTVEHPNVLTLGKNADLKHLLFSKDGYQAQGVDFFETERGGEVTAHMPGQLVVYPILPILQLRLSARSYVDILEKAVIDTLAYYGLNAARDPAYPGVWIQQEKICAIGVRIRSRVSMHGLALNVNNSLELFEKIVPCGIAGRRVTTMKRALSTPVDFDAVKGKLVQTLYDQLLQSFI